MAKGQLVFPGDEIAIAEEYLPGPGTYEDDGVVRAAWIGVAKLDAGEFLASVTARTTTPAVLRPGDLVIGRVVGMRSSFAIVRVTTKVDEPNRAIASSTNGTLHIAKVSHDYLDRIEDALRLGDLVRARVLEAEPALQLTTKGPEVGVLVARCPRCRTEMEARGHGLVCPECDWKARAEMAADYGAGLLVPPDDIEDRMRQRDEDHRRHGIDFPGAPGARADREPPRRGGPGGRGGPRGGGRGGPRRGGDRGGRGGPRRGGPRRGGRGGDRGGSRSRR